MPNDDDEKASEIETLLRMLGVRRAVMTLGQTLGHVGIAVLISESGCSS